MSFGSGVTPAFPNGGVVARCCMRESKGSGSAEPLSPGVEVDVKAAEGRQEVGDVWARGPAKKIK